MSEQVSYFTRRSASGRTDIIRRLPGGRTETFGPTGTWEPLEPPAPDDPAMTPIAAEHAALEIYQLRERGVVPKVEGVAIPLLPRSTEPAPRPGAGPVDIFQAQAIADEWMGRAGSGESGRGGVYEFDAGFVVYPLIPTTTDKHPADSAAARPRSKRTGAAVGVIDRNTGELTLWPNIPHRNVAEMYRRSRSER
ncbi:hypothetical protein [Nocardia cyriacigeorgica]|uniref:hypothetical protein n=1 Tax=Nocardia cyriacigeorgica TaxID=135487 RepID=UPI0018948BA1|nr:hypothetical protein [Nocardia cyriacigeorgica]MBF6412287.1 hypothetical protein [Nocardia cyriacigeorgica]